METRIVLQADTPAQTNMSIDSTTTASDPTDIIIELEDNTQSIDTSASDTWLKPIYLYHLVPAASALMDAADIGMSLAQDANQPLGNLIAGPLAAFITSYEFINPSSTNNFKEFWKTVRTEKRPEDWPELSFNKQTIVIAFTTASTPFGIFSAAAQAYFFVDAIPNDYKFNNNHHLVSLFKGLAVTSSLGVGINKFYTDNYEAMRTSWNLLAWKKSTYSSTVSKIISPTIGYPLGILKSFQDSVQSYIAIKTIFNIQHNAIKATIGGLSMLDGIPYFCFTGLANLNAIDEFFGYLQEKKIEPKKFAAFSLAVTISVYLAFLKRPLNVSFYNDVANDFAISNPDFTIPAFESLSWIMFVQESMQNTYSLYEPSYQIIDHYILNSTTWLANKSRQCLAYFMPSSIVNEADPLLGNHHPDQATPSIQVDIEPETIEPTTPTGQHHRDYRDNKCCLLFSHNRPEQTNEPEPMPSYNLLQELSCTLF